MAEKGIFTLEQEKKLAGLLDDAIKLKGVMELVDGLVFRQLLTLLDDQLINKLPEAIKVKLAQIAEAVIADDVETAETLATDLINSLIDVPVLDEESEGLLIGALVRLIVSSVLKWIEGKKVAPVTLKLNR
jgi:hypothetical protein